MMINDDWSPWLVSVLRLPQVKHLQRDKIKRIFDDLCGPKWEFTKQPAWFRKDMKRHGTSTMLQQLPKKKNEIHTSHWCNFMGWNDNPGCPRSKETMYPSWMIPKIPMASYLSVRERLWSSNRGELEWCCWWIQGSKCLGTFFSPRKPTWPRENPRFQSMYLLLSDFPLPCSFSGVQLTTWNLPWKTVIEKELLKAVQVFGGVEYNGTPSQFY